MNIKKIKECIEIASKAVEDIQDPKVRDKTYEIVLNNLMGGTKQVLSKVPMESKNDEKNGQLENGVPQNYSDIISKKLNVERERVEDFFEINQGNVEILFPLNFKAIAEQHFVFITLVLTIRKIVNGDREVDSSQVREMAKTKGLKSLVNFSTNIKKYPEYIIHKHGKIGSTSGSYKLTIDGYNRGIELLKKIFDGETIAEMEQPGRNKSKRTRDSNLTKEIDKLFQGGFFDTFKTVNDARIELKKRGFFNPRQDIDSYIRKILMQNKKMLIREKKEGVWQYVKRK